MPVGATPFGARYLNARLGRWMSPDPLSVHAAAADLNVYAYVRGRAFAAVDPWGLSDAPPPPGEMLQEVVIVATPPEVPYPPSAPLAPDAGVPPVFGGIDPGVARQVFNVLSGPPAQNLVNAVDAARKKNATLKGFGRGVFRSRLASVQEDITIPIGPMLPPGASPASIVPPNAGDPGEEAGEQFEKAVSFVARIALGGVAAVPTGAPEAAAPRAYSVAAEVEIPMQGIGTRASHFEMANKALLEQMAAHPEQAQAIRALIPSYEASVTNGARVLGASPAGWTWHHVATRPGVLQLVPTEQHARGSAFQALLHPGGAGGHAHGADYTRFRTRDSRRLRAGRDRLCA